MRGCGSCCLRDFLNACYESVSLYNEKKAIQYLDRTAWYGISSGIVMWPINCLSLYELQNQHVILLYLPEEKSLDGENEATCDVSRGGRRSITKYLDFVIASCDSFEGREGKAWRHSTGTMIRLPRSPGQRSSWLKARRRRQSLDRKKTWGNEAAARLKTV